MARLEGKVALISGAGRGIGAATAQAMVCEGAKVVIGERDDAEGQATAAVLGPAATFVHLDVTQPADWARAVTESVATHGKLNVLVNNAGIATYGPIDTYSQADWDATIAVDLTGVFHGIQAAVPAIKQAGGGSIVNVSSIAGLWGVAGGPGYVAGKFGVRGLTKAAALDLGKYGIRVNSVHPGFVYTAQTANGPVQPHGVLGRGAEPSEIANLIVFLASDESSFSTGSEFVADGGETAGALATPSQ
jgi:3alpha(or 20beta)-hydroxysteroid dehydrogenase